MSHTQEPWRVADESFDNDGIQESVIRGLDGRAAIAVTLEFGKNNPAMREANARRIVACVNACEGSPTDALEEMQHRGLTFGQLAFQHAKLLESVKDLPTGDELREAGHYLEQVSRQRDELLAALEKCAMFKLQPDTIQQIVNTSIASVKGNQPVVRDSRTTESAIPAIVFYPAGSLGEETAP